MTLLFHWPLRLRWQTKGALLYHLRAVSHACKRASCHRAHDFLKVVAETILKIHTSKHALLEALSYAKSPDSVNFQNYMKIVRWIMLIWCLLRAQGQKVLVPFIILENPTNSIPRLLRNNIEFQKWKNNRRVHRVDAGKNLKKIQKSLKKRCLMETTQAGNAYQQMFATISSSEDKKRFAEWKNSWFNLR